LNIYEYKNAYYVLLEDLSDSQQIWKKKENTYSRNGKLPKVDDVEDVKVGDLLCLSVSVRKEVVDEYSYQSIQKTNPVLGYTRFAGLVTKADSRWEQSPATVKSVTMILGSANLTMWIGNKGNSYYRNDIRVFAGASSPIPRG